jgi:hypothetical protein
MFADPQDCDSMKHSWYEMIADGHDFRWETISQDWDATAGGLVPPPGPKCVLRPAGDMRPFGVNDHRIDAKVLQRFCRAMLHDIE